MLRNYNKIRTLGKGAFGEVFLATEKISGKKVAIKCLLEKVPENQESILHEIKSVSKLSHPNVINYFHSFYDEGLLYLVMEYCSCGLGWLKVPKDGSEEKNYTAMVYDLEAGVNVRVIWKFGFYTIYKYLYAHQEKNNVAVIDFNEHIMMIGITYNFSL